MKRLISRVAVPMLIVSLLGFVIYFLSSRIEVQMEQSATENVREIVQVIESSIAEIRRNDVTTAHRLTDFFSSDKDTVSLLKRMQENSPFARISFVPADSDTGISNRGRAFTIESLPDWEEMQAAKREITDVYMSDLGAWTYTIKYPVYEEGKYTGDLYMDVVMERYDDILPDSIYQNKGLIYILDANTLRFIYEPTSTKVIISGKYDLHSFLNDFGILDEKLEQDISSAIEQRISIIAKMIVSDESSYVYFWPVDDGEWYLCGIIPEQSIQSEGNAVTQTIAATSILIFGAAALTFLFYTWYSSKNQKVRQYQIDLFHGIAKSIDHVVLLYDCGTGSLELAFDNIKRILGIDWQMLNGSGSIRLLTEEHGNSRLLEILRPETFQAGLELMERTIWNNPETGTAQYLEIETTYVILDNKKKCILSILDVTKEEQMQESLRASVLAAQNASRVKSDFLSQMSHEIRTPMNAVAGMVQIAEARLDDRDRVLDCLHKIKSSSQHLLGLINDILDISKIESQKMSLSEEWFGLEGLLDDLNNIVSVQAAMRSQRFVIQNQAGNVELLADRIRLSQVLMNLVNNSVKYTPDGGHITLTVTQSLSKANDYCLMHFCVEDDGIGMSKEFQKKLFTPFEREDNEAVRTQNGTGLGLSIVQSMVSLMGGTVRAESTKGVGTAFYVDIEFKCKSAGMPEQAAAPVMEICDFSGTVILLAEDNELNREIAYEFLEMANARVECAADGVEAFEKFRDSDPGHFDVILMDMQMPRWDGLEASRNIRALNHPDAKRIPIIAVTANAYFEDEQKCLEAGMDDHIAKPLDVQEFYKKVKKYLFNGIQEGESHD